MPTLKFAAVLAAVLTVTSSAFADLNLYTDRPAAVAQKLAADFQAKTGVRVLITQLPYATLKGTLKAEGADSPADVIYVKEIINLAELNTGNYFQAMPATLAGKVDPAMHAADNMWTAITYYARSLIYDASLDLSTVTTYQDLASSDYQGVLCLTAANIEVSGLVASLVANYGGDQAQSIVNGWVNNRVEPIFYDSDASIVRTMATGALTKDGSQPACPLGLVDSYELAGYMLTEPNAPVKIKFLKQGGNGVHTNGTGAGIAAHSKQKDLAAKFIDFMLSPAEQIYLSTLEQDFPAATSVKPTNASAKWSPVVSSPVNWNDIGNDAEKARLIMINSHYN